MKFLCNPNRYGDVNLSQFSLDPYERNRRHIAVSLPPSAVKVKVSDVIKLRMGHCATRSIKAEKKKISSRGFIETVQFSELTVDSMQRDGCISNRVSDRKSTEVQSSGAFIKSKGQYTIRRDDKFYR